MEYRYNFSFLPKWMHENGITATELLDVMGTRDYATLRRWVKGNKIMKLDAILSLCNAYNISMSCFFINKDVCPDFAIPSEEYDDKTELPEEEVNKKHGINPYISKKRDTILPGRWARLYDDKILEIDKRDISNEEVLKLTLESKYHNNISKITEKYQKDLVKLQKEFKIEKERLKKQLADKDNTILSLSKAISNVTIPNRKTYQLPKENPESNMVSEERIDDIK